MSTVKSWSYSSLSSYEMCPHAWMYERIVKMERPPSWHLTNGNFVHTLAEKFLLGEIEELPKQLSKFTKEFNRLREASAKPEEALVLNNSWQLLGGEDAWSSDDAWLRMKIDATVTDDYIIDFKTGKQYPDHIKQGRLYANTKMKLNPDINSVEVEFWYLNSGEVSSFLFERETLDEDIANWEAKVEAMHNDNAYEPRPHQYCKNCFVKHLCTAYN